MHPNDKGAKAYADEVQKELDKLDSKGIISGRIYNSSGGVIDNAQKNISSITFINTNNGDSAKAEIKNNGYYEFYGDPGTYKIEITYSGEKFTVHNKALSAITASGENQEDNYAFIKCNLREFKRNVDINIDEQSIIGSHETIMMGGYNWRILSENDDTMLVISENILEPKAYAPMGKDVTWETSEIRRYLNVEFYNRFSLEEKSRIVKTRVDNQNNSKYDTLGGNDTDDYIFLLSESEAMKYYIFLCAKFELITEKTRPLT